ncbi:MAG: YHYH protein [Solirubrobacterales bacterium]
MDKLKNLPGRRYLMVLAAVAALLTGSAFLYACGSSDGDGDETATQQEEDLQDSASTASFVEGALAEDITEISCTLTDGTDTTCNELTIAGTPANAEIGPFCPETTSTKAKDAGIWIDGENLYDADGEFIVSLADIYDDPNWKLYNDDGTVRVTDTKEAFEAAARPDVDEQYENYCVEGQIKWLEDGKPVEATYEIPDHPTNTGEATEITGKVGVTLNGVVIDPSAPVAAILGAYTIAAFDDCGGHVNPVEGYHIHAATDCSEVGEAEEGETRAFAIAMDGFSIHSPYADGDEPSDLDQCGGHETESLGYHYHANAPEDNAVLSCLMGSVVEGQNAAAGGPPAGGPPAGEAPAE